MSNDLSPPEDDDGRPLHQGPTDAEQSPHSTPNILKFRGHADDLIATALAIRELDASVIGATDIGTHAIEYGVRNWPVFPGNGKVPAIRSPHPEGSIGRQTCKGECGLDGHGVLDAATDVEKIAFWWGGKYAGCNILGRVPESMFVTDVDPRHGGLDTLAALENRYGKLPETLMTISGRMDGGAHYFYRRPPGKLSSKRLGPGSTSRPRLDTWCCRRRFTRTPAGRM